MNPRDLIYHIKRLRATKERIAIFKIFQKSHEPICAEQIYTKVAVTENIGLATIYRTLKAFEKAKLIEKVAFAKIPDEKKCTYYEIC